MGEEVMKGEGRRGEEMGGKDRKGDESRDERTEAEMRGDGRRG